MLDIFARNIEPPSDLHPADWCALHVGVENSERSEKFDPSQTRWWRKPMGCYADYETTNVVCIMPTGSGKSTFFEAINCWIVGVSPGSALYASQTNTDAEFWMETRLLKALKRCIPLEKLWPANLRNAVRKDAIVWPHMFFLAGGANISNFQEKSITYGQGDEVWKWKNGMVREWLARSHNRSNRKFVLASQAGNISTEEDSSQTSELHIEHDKCRRWEFGWKCPNCETAHQFSFANLKWDDVKNQDGTPNDQMSADSTRMECPSCKSEFADTVANRRMLHDSLELDDGYIIANPNGQRGYEGFHVDATAIWWIPWAEDVLQKIMADRQMAIGDHTFLKAWTQKRRAVGWSNSSEIVKISLKPSGYTMGDYEEHRRIDDEKFRSFTMDAGGDHFWGAIRAWAGGGDSRLLWFGYIASEQQAEELRIKYGVEPRCTFLDIGFEQERMAEIICRYGWRGIKGDGNRKSGWDWEIKSGPKKGQKEIRLYSKRWFAKAKNGQRAECYHVATEPLQYILQRLINGEGAKWEAYDDAPPTYQKHLNGERLVTGKDGRGREVKKWDRFGANHGRDCELYGLASALMFKVFTFEPQSADEN